MNDDEDIFRLPDDAATPPPSGKSARLDSIRKQRDGQAADSLRKPRKHSLRPIKEDAAESDAEPVIPLVGERRGRSFEGKSVEYNIDEIIEKKSIADTSQETKWGETSRKIPMGWIFMLSSLMLALIGFVIYIASRTREDEKKNAETKQIQIVEEVAETEEARALVFEIESTVRSYLAAKTVEEILPHVRYPESMLPRLERYYAMQPVKAMHCTSIANLKSLTLGGKSFWQVVAVTGPRTGQSLLLEQLSPTEVKVDWESHVQYQPMPWDEYAVKLPTQAMSFRVEVEEAPRYMGEFSDASRWVSYQLNGLKSNVLLYAYVLRGSMMHLQMDETLRNGRHRMILRLQASKAINLPNAVVVDAFISGDLFRIDAPKSLID
jgi:hypothetical protein